MSLHPYLTFSMTAREAMTRYHEVLGGNLEIMSFADVPGDTEVPAGVPGDAVMHAALTFGDGELIMASDDPTGDGAGVKGVSLALLLDDEAEVRRVFDAFAEAGEITMPLGRTFFSPLFGLCTDRFGVSWMVNVPGGD